MKKAFVSVVLILCMFFLTSCYPDQEEVRIMFESFEQSDDYVLLTLEELVIGGVHYKRSEIKYNGKETTIVFLEQNGYYSYTYDEIDFHVEFLFTTYDDFNTVVIGETTLPNKEKNSFYADDCFWFRFYDSAKEEQDYYGWSVIDKTPRIVDDFDHDYEYSEDNNRTKDYTLHHESKIYGSWHEITDNKTGEKKRLDKSVLDTFEEGRKLKEYYNAETVFSPGQYFSPGQVYIIGDDVYFVAALYVGILEEYRYVVKWNFNTEECEFITWTYFDFDQEWEDDFIIRPNPAND